MALETLKNNRYRIVRPLGSGSTGEVYLVEDNLNDRQEVVLKLLYAYAYPAAQEAQGAQGVQGVQGSSQAFEFEARAVTQLNHPNILPVLDYGTEEIDSNVVPYIVIPYCPDGSLARWLEQRSNSDVLTLNDAARIVRQVADALQYAHNQGVVHRDVKSANVFIRNKLNGPPDMLVADFGFAQPLPEARARGLDIRGTPSYMAPEQWEGQVVPASDQYALGVLVYQLLTGRLPFEGSVEQLRDAHHHSWPVPPSTINPTLPRAIDIVVGRAMAKVPGDRYPTISAFAHAFAQATQPVPEPVVPPPVYLAAPPTPPEGINVRDVTPTPPTPRRRISTWMIFLITALVLVVVLGGIGLLAYVVSNNTALSSVDATATANANANANITATSNANTTATTSANATSTANVNTSANATSTANANATATAQTHGNANATATANANASATAQANANATATVAPAAALSGNWVNEVPNTGITRLIITNNGLTIAVQAFAMCPPATNPCDWGTKSANYTGSPFKIIFIFNGSTEALAISTQGAQLAVIDTSSTNGVHTYLFNKQ